MLGVKIQNRTTGKYARKGIAGWSEKGKVWSDLRDAKLAICPTWWHHKEQIMEDRLNADFVIIDDDGKVTKQPCAIYILDYLKRQKGVDSEVIKTIEKFCRKNNIEIKEEL